MKNFEFNVDVERTAVERYSVTVEANDEEEAQDLVYEYFVDYPNGQDFLKKRLRTKEDTKRCEVIQIEFERAEEDLVGAVFHEND